MKPYGIGTNETVQYFNGTVKCILVLYYHLNFVGKCHVYDPGQSLINDNFTVVSISKSNFNPNTAGG